MLRTVLRDRSCPEPCGWYPTRTVLCRLVAWHSWLGPGLIPRTDRVRSLARVDAASGFDVSYAHAGSAGRLQLTV